MANRKIPLISREDLKAKLDRGDDFTADNAARELVALGYTNVKEFAGGKEEWRDAELPLER